MLELYYQESVDEDEERGDFIVIGEDTSPDEDSDQKPIRILSEFTLYDPKHGNELISLLELENEQSAREFRAAGTVAPVFVNEEDAGQEDDEDQPTQRLRTTEVFRYSLDLTRIDE